MFRAHVRVAVLLLLSLQAAPFLSMPMFINDQGLGLRQLWIGPANQPESPTGFVGARGAALAMQTETTVSDEKNLQQEKLRLEIDNLRKQKSWEGRLGRYVPFATAIVAIAGLWFGFVQFIQEQKSDRDLRIQNQIQANVSELLEFPGKDERSVSRVSFLLSELLELRKHLSLKAMDEDRITTVLVDLVKDDLNFDKLRHLQFDVILLESWPGYLSYLAANPKTQRFILYKYYQALRQLHFEDPKYFETIQYLDGQYKVERYTQESRYLRFQKLVAAYSRHLQATKSPLDRKQALDRFTKATSNSVLTKQIFGSLAT
jgi:hypothetical protein